MAYTPDVYSMWCCGVSLNERKRFTNGFHVLDEENHDKLRAGYQGSWPRFGSSTLRI